MEKRGDAPNKLKLDPTHLPTDITVKDNIRLAEKITHKQNNKIFNSIMISV